MDTIPVAMEGRILGWMLDGAVHLVEPTRSTTADIQASCEAANARGPTGSCHHEIRVHRRGEQPSCRMKSAPTKQHEVTIGPCAGPSGDGGHVAAYSRRA